MVYRGSFSQCSMFWKYPRNWFFKYVLSIPEVSDFCYANAGKSVHKCLEEYYQKKITDIQELKKLFEQQWTQEYKLNQSKISEKKDFYWLMVLNSRDYEISATSTELKIFYPDVLAYLDIVDTVNHTIGDHKTSKRDHEHEIDYKNQMIFYAWLYYRKFNVLVKKCTVYYLQYTGTKGIQEIYPTMEDIKEIESWYNGCLTEMEKLSVTKECPSKCKECNPWCSYTKLCNQKENEFTVKLSIYGTYFYINCTFNDLINRQLHKKFSYEQTKDSYMNRKWNKKNPIIDFYNESQHKLPLGFLQETIKTFNDYAEYKKVKLNLIINDTRQFNDEKIDMPDKLPVEMRYYQKDAGKVIIDNKIASIEIGTGGGKTLIAIEAIRQLGYKTLFIVDRKELMTQTINNIKKNLGIKCGKYGDGKKELNHITVGMIQSLNNAIKNNDEEIINYLKSIRFLIFDEAHKCSCDSMMTLNRFTPNAEYKLCMSGTLYRNDGETMKIESIAGKILYSKPAKELIQEGFLMKPNVVFISDFMTKQQEHEFSLKCKTGLINEEDDYRIFYDTFIINNEIRNNLVKDIIEFLGNKKVLIIVKSIEHGKLLESLIPNSKYLYGLTEKKEREDMFNEFVNGDLNVLISSILIFSEGIDLPFLEYIIMMAAPRADIKVIQSLGRVLRKEKDKLQTTYIDFLDFGGMIKNASICRRRSLRKQGHEVKTITFEEYKAETQSI